MRLEPTTNILSISDLEKFCKGIFGLRNFSEKVLVVGPFLARAVQEPLRAGHDQWCPRMTKDFNFVLGQENFFRI